MSKLALLFPGIGYTCDRPLLYYGRKLAGKAGYEISAVSYVYDGDMNIRGNVQKMEEAFRELYRQAQELLSAVEYERYEEVLFLSKSVGTVIAAAYAKELREKGICKKLRHIFYTPLEYTFKYDPDEAMAFLGSSDPWCVPEEVIRIAKEHRIPLHVYENANHSLETGDALKDLDILKDVMDKTEGFIRNA